MNMRFFIGFVLALTFTAGATVEAGIIVDHQPFQSGGPGSDTLFTTSFGQPIWQWIADDFVWTTSEQLTHVKFWGFYNANNPPTLETFRLRFYLPRPSDGLPGQVVHEETIQNPSRTATGRIIQTGIGPNEYFFEAPLAAPVTLAANDRYWLEVVQLGDITTNFRWETSVSGNSQFAYNNPLGSDWRLTQIQGDQAFQLISPEPTSAALFVISFSLLIAKRSRRIAA